MGESIHQRLGGVLLNESSDLFLSHEMVIRSLQLVPVYCSGPIPPYPGKHRSASDNITSKLIKDQDEWALYMSCTFDICNIDGIPFSLIKSVILGERVSGQYYPVTGRPIFLRNNYTYHRPWIAIINFLKVLHIPSTQHPTEIPFINRSIILQMKQMSYSMKTVPQSRRDRVTSFRNRNSDKWADGDKLCSRYAVGWGINGGWSAETENPNYSGHIPGYQEFNNDEHPHGDDNDDLTDGQRQQAAQVIADFQNITDSEVNCDTYLL